MTQSADYVFGVSWYGDSASIAQTGYEFTRDEASRVAKEGAEAPDFWAWAADQSFAVDELTDGTALPVVRADAETEEQTNEFTAWMAATPTDLLAEHGVISDAPLCSEGEHINDDNPGKPMCKTCDDWMVEQIDSSGSVES